MTGLFLYMYILNATNCFRLRRSWMIGPIELTASAAMYIVQRELRKALSAIALDSALPIGRSRSVLGLLVVGYSLSCLVLGPSAHIALPELRSLVILSSTLLRLPAEL